MEYEVHGPYELPKDKDKNSRDFIDFEKEAINNFWETIEKEAKGLKNACGCYIFTVNDIPYYVGKAEKQSFADECFSSHKKEHYRKATKKVQRGKPCLYFITKITKARGAFAKPSKNHHKDIDFLEKFFMALALEKNPNLTNEKHTRFIKNIIVPGFLNTKPGQPKGAHQKLKKVLGA